MMKGKNRKRIMSSLMALLMAFTLMPADFTGGGVPVRAANNTINGWTNLNNVSTLEVTEQDSGITLAQTSAVRKMGGADLSTTNILAMGEATTKDFSISADITVDKINAATNSSGIAIGALKKGDLTASTFAYLAYRTGSNGNIKAAYQKTDSTYGSTSVNTAVDTATVSTEYKFAFSKNSSGIICTVNDGTNSYEKNLGKNTAIDLAADELYPCIIIDGVNATIKNLEVTVDGEKVYPLAQGSAVKASVKQSGTKVADLSGKFASVDNNTLSFTPATLALDAAPADNFTVEADASDELGGTYTAKLNSAGNTIDIYNSNVGSGAQVIASLPYKIAGQLAVMSIGTPAESCDFKTTKQVFGEDSVTADEKFSENSYIKVIKGENTSLSTGGNTHGINFSKEITFVTKVPANAMGQFTFNYCTYGSSSAQLYVDGTAQGDAVKLYDDTHSKDPNGDPKVFEYKNTTDSVVEMQLKVTPNGSGYIHGVSYEVKEIPQLATVSGSVGTQVAGGTLTFKAGTSYTTTVAADGSYSITLPVGAQYTVELTGVTGYKLANATVDLKSANAGDNITGKNFTPSFWNTNKSGTVTIGGTTFNVAPGADEKDDFKVTVASGDGTVEVLNNATAVVWANLGGAGKGSVSDVSYTGALSGTVSGNKVKLAFTGDDMPSSYTLEVKDNSATGTPVRDGSVNAYNLGDGSVISTLYAGGKKLTGGNSTTSADKLVTFTGNNGIYYNGAHGIYISDGDVISVKVAGDAKVSFAMCNFSQGTAQISATATTGTVTPAQAAMKVATDGAGVVFDYSGEAATLTFTISSPGGTSYIHSMQVTNPAPQTTVNESAVKVKPEILSNIGKASNLTVTASGQKLSLIQKGGSIASSNNISDADAFANNGVSFYAFPATKDWNVLTADVTINSIDSASNNYGAFIGAVNQVSGFGTTIASVGVRKETNLRGIYTKSGEYAGGGQANATVAKGTKIRYTVQKTDGGFTVTAEYNDGKEDVTNTSTFKYNDGAFVTFRDNGADTEVYYGLILAGVDATVENMKYTDKSGNVLYDQNAYYNPTGEAPVVSSVKAVAAQDRTRIDVSWTGSSVYGDGKFVLQMSKDGSTWEDVADDLTGYSYAYPVSADASGSYKFRVCGTLGNSDAQSAGNRNTYVESDAVTITAALAAPVITLPITSPTDKVTLSWTASAGAVKYEVYRRSGDEDKSSKLAEVTSTSYTDTAITAEVPYYYYVIAKSADNFSNPQEESWTLPTAGHTGVYGDAQIAVTKKSYETVFKDTIEISGLATAPGKLTLSVNGSEAGSTSIAQANGTFSFTGVKLNQGRNDVVLTLSYNNGQTTKKSLNFVYLTNYDYVVDDDFKGTDGDTTEYGVPQYKTIAAAIAAIDTSNSSRKVILVREGDYEERLDIKTPNISLIGEDSLKTVIHCYPGDSKWGLTSGNAGGNTSERCAILVEAAAKNFSAENLTMKNDWEYKGDGSISNESADVLCSEGDGAMYVNVRFLGYQDTIDANKGHQYYYKCYVAGNVDFIYGNSGMALFDDCDIVFRYNANKNSGYVSAMKTPEDQDYGLIFNSCRIIAEDECSGSKYYLGRPWGEYAAATYIDCYLSDIINRDTAFTTWGGKDYSTDEGAFEKVRYYECNSYGPGYAVNRYRRQISRAKAESMLSSAGLGWNPYDAAGTIGTTNYVGNKTTAATDKTTETTFNTDKYSAYEGDDTGLGRYDQEGYAQSSSTTGGGLLKETNKNYYKVANAKQFLDAMMKIQKSGAASVIEITGDINLGSKEVADYDSYSAIIKPHNVPLTHPTLLQSGVSRLYIKGMSDLTIFSSNGSSIKHAALDINGSDNIIIRNIVFDELWEWDEDTAGDYDTNDWDYVTIEGASSKIWIDHCTFYKAYDGIVDIKTNNANKNVDVTVSWCEFRPGSEDNVFFNKMMDTMKANPGAYPYYKSLLDSGMTQEQIWWYAYGQKKTHLLGQADNATENKAINATFANNYYFDSMDRMPRLRFGNAHVYNCIMDAQELADARASITNPDAAKHIVSNGASSTCGAQVLVEHSYINGITNALNSGNGSSPAGYIVAKDTLYYVNGVQYAAVPKVNTTYEGATVLTLDADAFKAALPYSGYVVYDADDLATEVKPYTGAGKLNLTVLQWEKTSYNDGTWTAPTPDLDIPEDLPVYNPLEIIGENVEVYVPEDVKFFDENGKEIENGNNGNLILKAEDAPASVIAQMQTAMNNSSQTIAQGASVKYYDVNLTLNNKKVTFSGGKLTLTFSYPDGTSKDGYEFSVYHGLGDKAEKLNATLTEDGIRVEVSSLSPFAIVYKKAPVSQPSGGDSSGGDSSGGDSSGNTSSGNTSSDNTSSDNDSSDDDKSDDNAAANEPSTGAVTNPSVTPDSGATQAPADTSDSEQSGSAATGDRTPIAMLAVIMLLAMGTALALYRRKEQKNY